MIKRKISFAYSLLLLPAFFSILFSSCKKDDNTSPEEAFVITPLERPQGVSNGTRITRVIGTAGGVVKSGDESFAITIPAGALNTETTIGIEPITNTNIAGIGTAFRLTPHGQEFLKPVTIQYNWAGHADSAGLLQTLGLAYQMENKVWKFVGADNFDANEKNVRFNTSHFSDWSLMNRISLSPYKTDLETNAKQTIKALLFTEAKSDDLFVPLVNDSDGPYSEPGYPVGEPVPLPSRFIKSWELTGPGKITKASKSTIEYQAPASTNGSASATISLELNAPVAGRFLLLSTITILGDGWIELSIAGGGLVRFPASGVVKAGSRYLLSNPENEGGGYFLLAWNGGVGSHAYDLSNEGNHFHFQTAATTYISRYIPFENSPLIPSGGSISITKLSDGIAEGTFTVSNAGYGPTLLTTTSAYGKFKAKLYTP